MTSIIQLEQMDNLARNILFGVTVADSLGVPVEFLTSDEIDLISVESNYSDVKNRETGFGAWTKPIGTFSDDSSLTLCTAEYLAHGEKDLNSLMDRFKDWLKDGYWTADGETFDVGRTTLFAIENYCYEGNWKTAGLKGERDNGNGSLMRVAPLLIPLLFDKTITDTHQYISDFSSLTHAHQLSIDCCIIYLEFGMQLYRYKDAVLAFEAMKKNLALEFQNQDHFKRIFSGDFLEADLHTFNSVGFVVGALEIALYILQTTQSYKEAVLRAISLGKDTDSNAAITGGLAGVLYGYDNIPKNWIEPLKRKEDIEALAKNGLFN